MHVEGENRRFWPLEADDGERAMRLQPGVPRRLRGGNEQNVMLGACAAVVLLLLCISVSMLEPNEYGIIRNVISGAIEMEVHRGGVYMTGPTRAFIKFPATQMTLKFSQEFGADRPAVQTRTGADHGSSSSPGDADSGGQPITISCAIQYEFIKDNVSTVYLNFGSYLAAKQRYVLLAANMVSNTAQDFTPQEFWTDRRTISEKMLSKIQKVLLEDGSVNATRFELLKIDFAGQFEDAITQVQVAEQQKVVNEYDQKVQTVQQSIDVLQAENQANITAISSHAIALGRAQIANASRDGFAMKQGMKARKYAQLQQALGFNETQMSEYFKIKSIAGQESKSGKLIVGVPSVVGAGGSPARAREEL